MPLPRRVSAHTLTVVAGLTALTVTACSSGSDGPTPDAATRTATSGAPSAAPSAAGVAVDYEGIMREPETTSRPAAKDKRLVIISAGQASISSSIPVAAAKEAATALGWKVDVYDAQLNSANTPGLVRQATASGADGIVINATDCPTIKGPMQEAKAKGIKMVGIYAFDCSDPIFGGNDASLFSGQINYGAKVAAKNVGEFAQAYGAEQARAVIAATGGKAKVLFFNAPDVTVLKYTGKGFLDELKKCSGCEVVDEVDFQTIELGPNLQQKVTSALLKHPDANVVKSPFTAATLLGIAPAVTNAGRAGKTYVMGGEGFAPELDLLRAGQGVTAVNIAPSDWNAYAAIDVLNSLFTGKPIADSGFGWQLVDKGHNLPASGPFVPKVDFRAAYKKAWGVS